MHRGKRHYKTSFILQASKNTHSIQWRFDFLRIIIRLQNKLSIIYLIRSAATHINHTVTDSILQDTNTRLRSAESERRTTRTCNRAWFTQALWLKKPLCCCCKGSADVCVDQTLKDLSGREAKSAVEPNVRHRRRSIRTRSDQSTPTPLRISRN